IFRERDAGLARARDVAGQHARGIRVAVFRAERPEAHVVGASVFEELFRFSCGDATRGNIEARPHRQRSLECGDIAIFGDEKEVADLMEVWIGPDLVLESLDMWKRTLRKFDVDLARELKTDAAGVLSC